MATLLILIRDGKMINPAASERIYRNLIRIYWDTEALSQIPPTVQVASKSGAVDAARRRFYWLMHHMVIMFSVLQQKTKKIPRGIIVTKVGL